MDVSTRRKAALGVGLAAAASAVPLVAPPAPAAADHNGCQTEWVCFWSGRDRQGVGWSTKGNVRWVPHFGTESGYNHGTSRKRVCAYGEMDYVSIRLGLNWHEFKNYSQRWIASVKWIAGSDCP